MIRDCFSNVVQYLTEGTDTMYASGNGCPQVLLCRLPGLTKFYPPYTLAHRIFLKVDSQISLHPNCHSAFRNKILFKSNFWLTIFGLGHILLHFNALDDARLFSKSELGVYQNVLSCWIRNYPESTKWDWLN